MLDTHSSSQRDSVQRWASIALGLGVVALAGYLALETETGRPARTAPAASTAADAPPVTSATPPDTTPDASAPIVLGDLDAGLTLSPLSLGDAGPLPSGAPRSVKIGVVLVAFAGAEGAPTSARSKTDALVVAERLGAEARADFQKAVTAGDPGSAADIGRLPRGVLDPRTELAVFGLGQGEISDVLETPRGYWIVKRLD